MKFLSNVFVFLFVTLAFVSYALKKYQSVTKKGKSPPSGPWKLPLIGNIHQMAGGLPHRVLQDMAKKYGPIFKLQLGEIPIIVITSSKLAKEVLKTHGAVFAGRQQILAFKVVFYEGKGIVSSPYNDYWRHIRKICDHELLNAKTVRSLSSARMGECDRLISLARKSVGKTTFNLTHSISTYTMSIVYRATFGRSCVDLNEFIKGITEIMFMTGGFDIADLFPSLKFIHILSGLMPRLLKVHKRLDVLMDDMISEHIHNFSSGKKCNGEGGEEDLIDTLLRVKDNGDPKFPITNSNIKAMITEMFIAGSETSSTTTIWAMTELIRNPRVMSKAQHELRQAFKETGSLNEAGILQLKYLNFVVKETFRLHTPGPFLSRECLNDCVIDEYTIPAKTKVLINAWAMGRDPAYWPDPESFIPERFENCTSDFMGNNFEFLPFGAGKRICPGISFGVANIKLPLAHLLYHFDWAGLKPEDFDITETDGLTARRKLDLCLIPTLPSTPVG